ncbi:ferredoxin [Amycolatopsis sp. K13G38]|uniref:Ferredoxin n=1 Tax=Amycolatopsis acididurans TaxID=2724524 RepID=A0ABX1JET5_9PSEU|nr:ferredoxin [Amycolatopsis acididurans]NKQ56752.1 ferredoxin [Amycolatopsis acididurans]
MSKHLTIDREACAGHGICYGAAPEIMDCDDQGYPVLVTDPVPDDLAAKADHLVRACPEQALRLRG